MAVIGAVTEVLGVGADIVLVEEALDALDKFDIQRRR